ncbi:dihydroxyacetone kinase subunit L [Microvirga sp. VF16]|uniref:dihydroxyacetone kinase subunit L n=1 Tax=Microvirga sp. VF16 TaxID=2807101 RepID=UPI00193E982A|nr:dihydroxyacetone kinase subunit L [Microvirga sp. VF16]QRM33981.1 dihydroxyacetone kinase subunit L [Microvirga sp. VF16]
MGWTVDDIARAVARAQERMGGLEQELNEADSRLGDGDTGSMLARVVERMSAADLTQAADVGAALGMLARSTLSATGSSLGTLIATALMTMSRKTKGQTEVAWTDLSGLLAEARDAMIARGGAQLGDKTVLDALDAVASAISGQEEKSAVAAKAQAAAHEALDQFRSQPCRIGRARMFPEKSVGSDDPGMLAFVRLTDAVTVASSAAVP